MFTGLIADLGTVESLTPGEITDVWIASHFPGDFVMGESISCDGVCLTVIEWKGSSFKVQAANETLRRSTLGSWRQGTKVNLERAMRVGDRLGGHWVQGHVDAVGELLESKPDGASQLLRFSMPESIARYFVEKGSVCIDGVSLTVTGLDDRSFSVMLIPETLTVTSLGTKGVGSKVNLESDIVGKYVERMMGARKT